MSKPTEAAVPVVHRRVINWSDTDAARIVYTVRFLDFAMEAVEQWFRNIVGCGWYEMNMDLGLGAPFVKVDIDFKAPLTSRDKLSITVLVERAGRSSITFNVAGDRDDGGCEASPAAWCAASWIPLRRHRRTYPPNGGRTSKTIFRGARSARLIDSGSGFHPDLRGAGM